MHAVHMPKINPRGLIKPVQQARRCSVGVKVALIAASAGLITTLITTWRTIPPQQASDPRQTPTVTHVVAATPFPIAASDTGRLEGVLRDRTGMAISSFSVRVDGGNETTTDSTGKFVIDGIPAGDRMIRVKSPSGSGTLDQQVRIERDFTTHAVVVYDSKRSLLGLLSITAPVDEGILELQRDRFDYRGMIYGRCNGMAQLYEKFEVWVLIRSDADERFWVQHPPATINPNDGSWRAKAVFGSPEIPPRDGEHWEIIAVAAEADSDLAKIGNVVRLGLLPPHSRSNVVSVKTKIKR